MPSISNFSGLADNETKLEQVTEAVLPQQGCVLPVPSSAKGAGMAATAQDPFSTLNV